MLNSSNPYWPRKKIDVGLALNWHEQPLWVYNAVYSATPHHCLHWNQKTMLRIFGDNQPRGAVDDAKQLLLDSSRSTCWKSTGMAEFRVTGLKQKMKGKSTILTRKINFWKIIFFQLLYSLKQLAWNSGSHVCSKHISTSAIRQLKKVPRSPYHQTHQTHQTQHPWLRLVHHGPRPSENGTWPGLELLRRNDGLVLVMPAFPGVELRNLRKIRAWDRGWPHVVGMTGAHGINRYSLLIFIIIFFSIINH